MFQNLNQYKVEASKIADQAETSPSTAAASILHTRGTKGSRAALMCGLVIGALVERGKADAAEQVTIALGKEVERGAARAYTPSKKPANPNVRERFRISCTDSLGNVSYLYRPIGGSWCCVLGNGTPAALSYAGIPHNYQTAARFALDDTRTSAEALAVLASYGGSRTYTIIEERS